MIYVHDKRNMGTTKLFKDKSRGFCGPAHTTEMADLLKVNNCTSAVINS